MFVNVFLLSSSVILNFAEWLHVSCVCDYNSISFTQKFSFTEVLLHFTVHKKFINSEEAILFYL